MAAAAQCSSLLCSCSRRPCTTRSPLSLFSPSHLLSPFNATPIRASPKQLKLSTSRTGRVVSAVVSAENTVQSSFSGTDGFKLTYLEELLSKELPDAQVLQPTPGVPLQIPLRPNLP